MTQYYKRWLLLTLMFLGMSVVLCKAATTVWTVDNLPMVHLQDARRYVCDPDGLLSVAARDSADRMLFRLEQTKGIESVVVVVKRLAGGDCYDFGMQLGRKYGIGSKKQNSGLIVVISTEDRGYYILTGRGLEGALPDAICRRIQNRYMVPALKVGDWDTAVMASVLAISRYVQGDHSLTRESRSDSDTFSMWAGLIVALAIVGLMMIIARRDRRSRRCPQCHKGQMMITHRQRFRASDGRMMVRVTRQCSRCGYTELTDEDDDDDDRHTGMLAGFPFLFMGGGHGNGGGGGFGGGSFGGGSFGGGGSGGRF